MATIIESAMGLRIMGGGRGGVVAEFQNENIPHILSGG